MKKFLMMALVAMLFYACGNDVKETPSGLKFTLLKKGDGIVALPGEYLRVGLRYTDKNDSVWRDNSKDDFPTIIPIPDLDAVEAESDVEQLLRMLSAGDSVVFTVKAASIFQDTWQRPLPPGVEAEDPFVFHISVYEIINQEQLGALQEELYQKQMEANMKLMNEQLTIDADIIDEYLSSNNISASQTEAGVRYVITKKGTGENAKSGQTVLVNYTGYVLNGEYFDSSIKKVAQEKGVYNAGREPYEPFSLTIDESSVIQGWHDALKQMNKGSQGTFYIPSSLGWGPQRVSDVIVENAIVVFDIEMLEIN
jgi:FKBP-type peptidyl-prolyl cis-trans isomerase FkpA